MSKFSLESLGPVRQVRDGTQIHKLSEVLDLPGRFGAALGTVFIESVTKLKAEGQGIRVERNHKSFAHGNAPVAITDEKYSHYNKLCLRDDFSASLQNLLQGNGILQEPDA